MPFCGKIAFGPIPKKGPSRPTIWICYEDPNLHGANGLGARALVLSALGIGTLPEPNNERRGVEAYLNTPKNRGS